VDNDRRWGSTATLSTLDAMRQAFQGSGVIMHAIDIKGVRVQNNVSEGARGLDNNDAGLFILTEPTGGTVFHNSNDFAADFARMLHQQEVVYVLGFQSTVTNPGKLHDLRVELIDGPRGASVQSRRGYFEGGPASTLFEP